MKFSTAIVASAILFASFATAAPEAAVAAEVAATDFGKRACTPSKCRCNGIQGQFCGTSTVNPDCVKGHVYECNPSGATCDYGIRNSCVQCNKLVC